MSMRGDNISKEYQRMVWVQDENGKEFACYANDLQGEVNHDRALSAQERDNCLDVSQVLGDSW